MKSYSMLTLLLLAVTCVNQGYSIPKSEDVNQLLESLVGENSGYNPGVKPEAGVNVSVNMFVRSFNDVNTKEMTMTLQVTFRQKWYDPRLRYNSKSLKMINIPSLSSV